MKLLTSEVVKAGGEGLGIKIDRKPFSWVRGDLLLGITSIVYHFPVNHNRMNRSQASVTMLVAALTELVLC